MLFLITPALLAFGKSMAGPLLSGGLSLIGGNRANVASAQQAKRQMDFQERMSNTAHQRQVEDLKKAGLNPILSATGGSGASSPGGAMAMQTDVITPALNSAISVRRANQELKNLRATELLIGSQTDRQLAETEIALGKVPRSQLIGDSIASARAAVQNAWNRLVYKFGGGRGTEAPPKTSNKKKLTITIRRGLDRRRGESKSAYKQRMDRLDRRPTQHPRNRR